MSICNTAFRRCVNTVKVSNRPELMTLTNFNNNTMFHSDNANSYYCTAYTNTEP